LVSMRVSRWVTLFDSHGGNTGARAMMLCLSPVTSQRTHIYTYMHTHTCAYTHNACPHAHTTWLLERHGIHMHGAANTHTHTNTRHA